MNKKLKMYKVSYNSTAGSSERIVQTYSKKSAIKLVMKDVEGGYNEKYSSGYECECHKITDWFGEDIVIISRGEYIIGSCYEISYNRDKCTLDKV